MIIACPACSTRYVVPDSAIGVDGRTVRCAKCRHSWFQNGPELELTGAQEVAPAAPVPPPPQPDPEPQANEAAAPPPPSQDESAEQDTPAPPVADAAPAAAGSPDTDRVFEGPPPVGEATPPPPPFPQPEEGYSQFDYEPPFRRRRNPLKLWTALAALFALLAAGTIGAISYYGTPEWLPVSKPTFGVDQPDLRLDFPGNKQDRRVMSDGSILFAVSGTITNIGRETRRVPNVLVALYDANDTRVWRWVIKPPAETLAPGESVTINEARNDAPKRARRARIGWDPN